MSKFVSVLFVFYLFSTLFSPSYSQSKEPAKKDSLSTAQAQEAEIVDSLHYILNEVVVTGTRTYKKIIDIPYPVQRIDNTQFRYDKKTAVNDVLQTVPGLFMQSRYGNHDVRISIRGFGSRSNTGIRGVRILLDGIAESEPDGQTRIEAIDFNSIGSIEIVKGNSSSLYTNAPGGVINFINDITFPHTFITQHNEFGSYDLRRNGFKLGVRTPNYTFLTTYTYHNSRGFRQHSDDYWHILNTVLEARPGERSTLQLLGYFVDGRIRLPGSLTKEQYEEDPFQANPRDVGRDTKRITTKGRLGVRYTVYLDDDHKNQVELTTYGTIKYFERTSSAYRIINRYGLGATPRFINKSKLFGRKNEFSVGGDVLYQTGPVEFYRNINGQKSDELTGLTNDAISNAGFYVQNSFNLIPNRMDFLLTGRYDNVVYNVKNQILEVQNARRSFKAFTPKAALNFKLTPWIAAYTSYGRSFDSPAGNELDNYPTSSQPTGLLNPDLQPQESKNFEIGIKGNLAYRGAPFFNNVYFEATFFNLKIDQEIVPFDVYGDVYYRNSAKTNRTGLELGTSVEIARGLKFDGAYTFSDFVYDQYDAVTIEVDSIGNVVSNDRDFSGNIVPSVPRHNLSVSLSYQHILKRGITGFIKGNNLYISGMFTDDRNSEKTNSYNIVNSTVGLDLTFNYFNLLLSGGVNNVFDTGYVAFININSSSGEFYEAGAPRNYFANINLGYRF